MTADQLTAVRRLLGESDPASVRQGIALLRSLDDPVVWTTFAQGVSVAEDGRIDIGDGCEIATLVGEDFRLELALWALRGTGQLQRATALHIELAGIADLEILGECPNLRALNLNGCSDLKSLKGLGDCPRLQGLDLSSTALTDLAEIGVHPHLQALNLACTEVVSLAGLGNCPQLQVLNLSSADVTSLEGLEALPMLRELQLDGCASLTSLDGLPAAATLVGTDGDLALNGVTSLSEAQAERLVASGAALSLDGLSAVSEATAAVLATHTGDLSLGGLASLSPGVAALLADHTGSLSLDGLETLPATVAAVLARHRGSANGAQLSLDGLKTLPAEVATVLATIHAGRLSLCSVEAPEHADEIFGRHRGRVSLGGAFQYIDIGVYEDPDAYESYGKRVDATPLTIPVDEESTFTLGYDRCGVSEDVIGVISDDTVRECLEGDSDWDWYDADGILHRYGLAEPATVLELPDGTREPITLRHWPPSLDFEKMAFQNSDPGDFLHISCSYEKARTWDAWKTYRLTLTEGDFDLSRIRVQWENGFVSGYSYLFADGEEEFEEVESVSTDGQGIDHRFYFNTGMEIVRVDFEELAGELEDAGVDATDLAAVRAYLREREAAEVEGDASDAVEDEIADSADAGASERDEAWQDVEYFRFQAHLHPDTCERYLQGLALGGAAITGYMGGGHFSVPTDAVELGDGTVASCGRDGFVRFWDLQRSSCTGAVYVGAPVTALLLSPAGSLVIVTEGTCAIIPAGSTGVQHRLGPEGAAAGYLISSSPPAQRMGVDGLATFGTDGVLRVWDLASRSTRATRDCGELEGFWVLDDDRVLILTGTEDLVWNARTDVVETSEAAPDCSDGPPTVRVLPGARWATIQDQDEETVIRIRDVQGTARQTVSIPSEAPPWGPYAFADGHLAAWGRRPGVEGSIVFIVNPTTGQLTEQYVDCAYDAHPMPLMHPLDDGSMFISYQTRDGDERAEIIHPDGRAPMRFVPVHPGVLGPEDLGGIIRLHDGRYLSYGGESSDLSLWSPAGTPLGGLGVGHSKGSLGRLRFPDEVLMDVLIAEPS